jgi:hypothetical protein
LAEHAEEPSHTNAVSRDLSFGFFFELPEKLDTPDPDFFFFSKLCVLLLLTTFQYQPLPLVFPYAGHYYSETEDSNSSNL